MLYVLMHYAGLAYPKHNRWTLANLTTVEPTDKNWADFELHVRGLLESIEEELPSLQPGSPEWEGLGITRTELANVSTGLRILVDNALDTRTQDTALYHLNNLTASLMALTNKIDGHVRKGG